MFVLFEPYVRFHIFSYVRLIETSRVNFRNH